MGDEKLTPTNQYGMASSTLRYGWRIESALCAVCRCVGICADDLHDAFPYDDGDTGSGEPEDDPWRQLCEEHRVDLYDCGISVLAL